METTKLSEINIFKVSVPNWKDKKEKVLSLAPTEHLLPEDNSRTYSDYHYTEDMKRRTFNGTYRFSDGSGSHPYADAFFNMIDFKPHLIFGGGEGDYICTDLWCMRYVENGGVHVHDHGSGMSGILYADYDPVYQSATTFISPVRKIWDGYTVNYTPEVEEGDMILFPSQLSHYSKANTHSKDRVIFSFNIRVG